MCMCTTKCQLIVYFGTSANAMNSVDTRKQSQVVLNKMSRTCDVVKQGSNNVNTSEHDCVDATHVNSFAVLCLDSYEDEGDSLDFVRVNDPDVFCTVSGFQGGESVGMHNKFGKKLSNCVKKSPVKVSECQSVT